MTTIFEAMQAAATDVTSVGKTGRNLKQGYDFRGIDAVINAVGPAFRRHGIICVPLVESVQYETIEVGSNRTLVRECTVRVRYRFYGPEGDHIDAVVVGEAMDSGDKATPKAHSVAYRTCLLQALTIPTGEPDPDEATFERAPRSSRPDTRPPSDKQIGYAKGLAKQLGESAATVVPAIIEEITGRQAKLVELDAGELSRVIDELKPLSESHAAARDKVAEVKAAAGEEPFEVDE
jgi:hypothetical protein